mgnify:CR=1 FL=1
MSESDHILAERCQKGDRRAQKELYQQYRRMLFGVCLRYAANRQEAEDLLQESLLRISPDLYQYQPTGPLGAWQRRVTVTVAPRRNCPASGHQRQYEQVTIIP